MKPCCLSGTLATGSPVGAEGEIAGLPTYIAKPSDNSTAKTIIFLPDAFGWTLPNIRLLADTYATAGFTVYIPDVHNADSLPWGDGGLLSSIEPTLPARENMSFLTKTLNTLRAGASLGPWLLRHREAVSRPVIEAFINKVRALPGVEKVGVVGFCWGGRYAILAAQEPFSGEEGRGVDAAYVAHPSLCAIPGDFEDVCKPLSVALGEKDSYLGMSEVKKIEEVMVRKRNGEHGRMCEGEVVVMKGRSMGLR